MSQRKYNKEELKEAVKNSLSIAEVLRHLNIVSAGGNYFTVKRYIKLWNIDTSHFTGKLWNKGKHTICNPAKSLKEILKEDSTYQSYKLAKRCYFFNKCAIDILTVVIYNNICGKFECFVQFKKQALTFPN